MQDKPVAETAKPETAQEKADSKQKPDAEQKSAAKSSEGAEHGQRAERSKSEPSTRAARLLKRVAHKPNERSMVMLCSRFRTYNASSGSYRGYDGRMHSCR